MGGKLELREWDHEFIEVKHRRWCVTCSLFQTNRNGQWVPKEQYPCPHNTVHARSRRAEIEQMLELVPQLKDAP